MPKYPCRKCGRPLIKNGRNERGKQRWACMSEWSRGRRTFCSTTTNPTSPTRKPGNASVENAVPERTLKRSRRYIVTCAQNATPVHLKFWKTLLVAARHLKAELVVTPLRYKNPTSTWTKSQENEETWDARVMPYLYAQRFRLNSNLTLLADIKVQPTAVEPLSGFQGMTSNESCILGHTKMQLLSVPTPGHKMAKILTTTGACTRANYTDTKAGATGAFHHSLAALLVEIDGTYFSIRQLHANKSTGEFTDLDTTFTTRGVRKAKRPLAVVGGDMHVDFRCRKTEQARFGRRGLVTTLRPRHFVYHDLLDAYAVNGHHVGNPFNAVAKRMTGRDDARAEMLRAIEYVQKMTPAGCKAVVVGSNHDDMLRRWIIREDWRDDPTNAEFYLETALAMVRATRMTSTGTEYPSPLPYWGEKLAPGIKWLRGESFTLAGIELSLHGDRGPNGTRGSIRNLRRIGPKVVLGHSHSPGISEGAYQTGTGTELRAEYTGPVGSWLNADVVIHADGKRQLIIFVDGRYRL